MLSKETIKQMADLFFNGEPEKAYELFHDSNEWLQFQNSTCKRVPESEAYRIMANSDMTIWHKNFIPVKRVDYPTYDVGY